MDPGRYAAGIATRLEGGNDDQASLDEPMGDGGCDAHRVDRDPADEGPAEDETVAEAMDADERDRGPDDPIGHPLDEWPFEEEPGNPRPGEEAEQGDRRGRPRIPEERVIGEDRGHRM